MMYFCVALMPDRSVQYRLGLFGFLGGSTIAEEGSLNAGLLDQRLALDWVQRYARSFGGDPASVTIWGGSAGGGDVTYQLIARGGNDDPPFSAAIAEYPWWQPLLNASTQDRQYFTALRLANCSDLNCLRSLSAETLQFVNQADQNASYPGPGAGYGVFW
jgi:carboxylesterase type B